MTPSSPLDPASTADPVRLLLHENQVLRAALERERAERHESESLSRSDLHLAHERLVAAMECAGLGWWEHVFGTERVTRSPEWARMLGYAPEDVPPTLQAWRDLVHPDDLAAIEEAARRHEGAEVPDWEVEHRMRARDGSWKWVLNWGRVIERDEHGRPVRALGVHMDVSRRKRAELEREDLVRQLERALAEIRTLRGIIPICAECKKIRDDAGDWRQLETYLTERSEARFSHGLCPDCGARALAESRSSR